MQPSEHIGSAFAAIESHALRIHLERCAKVRNRNVSCLKCAQACTSGCISLVDGQLVLDPALCVGCGTCASVCPTCALESRNPSDAELAGECLDSVRDGQAYIACSPYLDALSGLVDEGLCARVVCLGRVEESLLAGLAADGVESIHLLCGPCKHCAQKFGRESAREASASALSLLRAFNCTADIALNSDVPSALLASGADEDEALARLSAAFERGVACKPLQAGECAAGDGFGNGLGCATAKNSQRLPHVMVDGTLPHYLPDRRERLLDALAAFGEPKADKVSSRLWGVVVIDGSKCISCCMCATFCPTGAIRKFDDADGAFGIEHFPGDCVKCGSCRDICIAGAIRILDEVPVRYIMQGDVHRYVMKPREVQLDGEHQIKNTVARYISGDVYER